MTPLRKLHAVTGLIVAGFLFFHAWEWGSAVDGQRAFAARFARTSAGTLALVLEVLLALLPMAIHAGTGIVLAVRARGSDDPGHQTSVGLRRVQLASGVLLLAFVVIHVGHLWAPKVAGAIGTDALYDVLMADLGVPVVLVAYVVGLAAACLHLCYGLLGALAGFRPDAPAGQRSALRIVAALASVALFVHGVNAISWFATGAGLFWGGP